MIFPVSILFAVAILFAGRMFRPFSTIASQTTLLDDDDEESGFGESRMHPSLEMGTFRTEFGSASSFTRVIGWPSTGGFYVMACDGVELEFLGLSRFEPTPRADDPADEDTHCAGMRKLGATFYLGDWDYAMKHNPMIKDSEREDPSLKIDRLFGWPSTGGVWVHSIASSEARAAGVGRIRNAFTMDERCREIQKMGGVFYPDPKDCPDLNLAWTG